MSTPTPALNSASSNLMSILALINLLAGTAGKLAGGNIGQDVTIGQDLLQVALQALALHQATSGVPIAELINGLHDLPPVPVAAVQP